MYKKVIHYYILLITIIITIIEVIPKSLYIGLK